MGGRHPALSELGLAGLHGSSPDVGIVGYSVGGGIGWLARKHGMQTNAVTAFEVVTADGELRRVDHDHEPDLFWALRGGNGNFGVVTALEFEVFPVEQLYAGALFFPVERTGEVLHTWAELMPSLPEEMTSWVSVSTSRPTRRCPTSLADSHSSPSWQPTSGEQEGRRSWHRSAASAPRSTPSRCSR